MWGMVGLGYVAWFQLGFFFAGVKILLALIFVTGFPGFALLRALGIHNLGRGLSILYAIGLSLGLVMLAGFLANQTLPWLGVARPITPVPILAVLSGLLGVLCLIDNMRNGQDLVAPQVKLCRVLSPSVLFFGLMPLLATTGAVVENQYQNNIILLFTLALVAILVLLVGLTRLIREAHFPVAIWATALALLYHRSLISTNLWGWDGFHEYYLANSILSTGSWNQSLAFNTNAMLGTVILAPTLTMFTGVSLVWVFKGIYPLVFSLVPVALYLAIVRYVGPKMAFFSTFFFSALFVFYGELTQLPREEIGEFFLALI